MCRNDLSGIIGTGIANGVWGPGAHYLFIKVLDKVFPG